MDIEFDTAKDAANLDKHGVSLSLGADMDIAAALVVADTRRAYGEDRFNAYGMIDGLLYCMTFTVRSPRIRIISLRRAHKEEAERF